MKYTQTNYRGEEQVTNVPVLKGVLVVLGLLLLFVALIVGGAAGCKSYDRYQKRADAKNQVKVTSINIQKANQQTRITKALIEGTKARAEMRYQEAIGIRKAQDEISKTLTPLYVQHEAIQNLNAARAVYIPSGPGGIPQVYDLGKDASGSVAP